MIDLMKYFGAQSILEKNNKLKGKIKEIEKHFSPHVNNNGLIIIPRFNGDYLSIRYCGLEVLRLNKNTTTKFILKEENGKIKGGGGKNVSDLNDTNEILEIVKKQLMNWLDNGYDNKNKKSTIPGFSLEHWLESLILADTESGKKTREHLKLQNDLSFITTQIPIIMEKKSTNRHIDIISVDNYNKELTIIELKIDNSWKTAKEELEDYTNWALNKLEGVDKNRGNIKTMIEEGYVPKTEFKKIRAISVIRSDRKLEHTLENGLKIENFSLPINWLENVRKDINLFS